MAASPAEGGRHPTAVSHLEGTSEKGAMIRTALEAPALLQLTLEQGAGGPTPDKKSGCLLCP